MAFTGTATIKQISDSIVRVTGLSLAGSASGTIALHGETGTTPDVVLPVGFLPTVYTYGPSSVTLIDSIKVELIPTGSVTSPIALDTNKTGTASTDFRVTIHNTSGTASPAFELYVSFHE